MHQPIFLYHYVGETDDFAEIPYWLTEEEFMKE